MAEIAEEVTTETVVKTEPQAQPKSVTLDELDAELDRTAAALKQANKEAAERRKKLDAFEKAEEERKKADLSATDRLKQELAQAQTQLQNAQRVELQRSVADEVGLPAVLATRIQGADRDAMLTDAKAMLEALPKQKPPTGTPTNPGAASGGETDAEKRKRLGLS